MAPWPAAPCRRSYAAVAGGGENVRKAHLRKAGRVGMQEGSEAS